MSRHSNYDKFPCLQIRPTANECQVGWPRIAEKLRAAICGGCNVLCVECYPGVREEEIEQALATSLRCADVISTRSLLKNPREIDAMLAPHLGDDPVFGRMNAILLNDFFDPQKLAAARESARRHHGSVLLIVGMGAALVAPKPDVLVYADLARWEIQARQRRGEIGNLGGDNFGESPSLKYKRAFFVDWRAADRLKKTLLPRISFLLDTNDARSPKMIGGDLFRAGLKAAAHRPFRVVPYFDPGPWGGHWMEEVCDLPADKPNHAWCFDCVPEENSLLLGFGGVRVEIPALNLVFAHPRELLGDAVQRRFGTEFPIRFDFLDTMGGGNLSLQVHPLTEYIQSKFGMSYTQDESYYLLDAGPDGCVYLGLREDIDGQSMLQDLRVAQNGGPPFPAEKYVSVFPAKKHDHFLIPAGTVHCSGKNSMVLEISATPYIFTFKLWDWGRLGLNGLPRPIHLEHGAANIQWDRTTGWVRRNLINKFIPVADGAGWREERTGLHEREFIETRRHWFTGVVPHHTNGGVNVLNLVEGRKTIVESPTAAFEPFVVHYAETFIVPAAVGAYNIRPFGESEGSECATIKAFVKSSP
ncbi:MAG: class I mannose-6-phosphate isomerase [Terriglobales bacterium]